MILASDPGWELGDAFAEWCEANDLDPDEHDVDDYLAAMADLDPRIGEDDHR